MRRQILEELSSLVGREYVMDKLEDLICYSCDATFRSGVPEVVVRPGSVEEIMGILRLAIRYGIPITPRGASTGLSGGAVPIKGGICLDLTRLNRILEIDVVNRVATVEPGVITDDLASAVSRAGLFYPPDPSSSKVCTIGGNIAECAGGPHGVKYGVTRDYVLGLEVVLPSGDLVQVGNPVDGEMSGPDWTMLLVGSEGTLGIVTRIFLRLVDKPATKKTLLAVFETLEDAATSVSTLIASGTIPTTLEIMDNLTIRAVEDYLKVGLPVAAEAILLIEVDGAPSAVEKHCMHVIEVCEKCHASDIQVAETDDQADKLWQARRAISAACGRINPTKISEDATVPRSQLPSMVRRVKEIAEKYRLKMVVFGHAGDGNLHPNILTNKHNQEEMQRVEQAIEELFRTTLELGGTLSGEHGIGYMKAPFLEWETGRRGFALGRQVKQTLDPQGLLNPGKMFSAISQQIT